MTMSFSNVPKPLKADYLVTGNARDFLRERKGTRIMNAREFLEIVADVQRDDQV